MRPGGDRRGGVQRGAQERPTEERPDREGPGHADGSEGVEAIAVLEGGAERRARGTAGGGGMLGDGDAHLVHQPNRGTGADEDVGGQGRRRPPGLGAAAGALGRLDEVVSSAAATACSGSAPHSTPARAVIWATRSGVSPVVGRIMAAEEAAPLSCRFEEPGRKVDEGSHGRRGLCIDHRGRAAHFCSP